MDAGFTCPNRDGRLGYGGCIYCYNPGFSPPALGSKGKMSIHEQIQRGKSTLKRNKTGRKFLVYFQPYTNTYAHPNILKKLYDEALMDEDVLGLCIGTRPDCVNEEILDLIESYTADYHIWIEYGLQSMHDETLSRINRGHSFAQFEEAVNRTKGRRIFICVHIILGLPGETKEDMLKTVDAISRMGIDGIKIHHLQVIEGTPLAEEFRKAKVKVFDLEEYIAVVCDIIEHLSPQITIQRLFGEVLEDRLLIAPRWRGTKGEIISAIENEFSERGSFQGIRFNAV